MSQLTTPLVDNGDEDEVSNETAVVEDLPGTPVKKPLASLPGVVVDSSNPVLTKVPPKTPRKNPKPVKAVPTPVLQEKEEEIPKKRGRGGAHGPSPLARILERQDAMLARLNSMENVFTTSLVPPTPKRRNVSLPPPPRREQEEEEEEEEDQIEEEEEEEEEFDEEGDESPQSERDPLPRYSASILKKMPRW